MVCCACRGFLGRRNTVCYDLKEDCVNNSSTVLACPVCRNHFPHEAPNGKVEPVFGFGLDFRLVPRDCDISTFIVRCPNCSFAAPAEDFSSTSSGRIKELIRSKDYRGIFEDHPMDRHAARGWPAHVKILEVSALSPRDLGLVALKGAWAARELSDLETEDELLATADRYLDDALRRGLTKGDPGFVIYLLGEINRRRGEFLRGKEMLTFLGNNPRYRYPALLLTVLIEEEDSTPYWSLHAPDEMEKQSGRFKGLFPALRSIPPGKKHFSCDELTAAPEQNDEDDRRRF